MNTNKRETALKAISNLKIKLQETKTKNEANTIQNFIIKILSEFGWDVFMEKIIDKTEKRKKSPRSRRKRTPKTTRIYGVASTVQQRTSKILHRTQQRNVGLYKL